MFYYVGHGTVELRRTRHPTQSLYRDVEHTHTLVLECVCAACLRAFEWSLRERMPGPSLVIVRGTSQSPSIEFSFR